MRGLRKLDLQKGQRSKRWPSEARGGGCLAGCTVLLFSLSGRGSVLGLVARSPRGWRESEGLAGALPTTALCSFAAGRGRGSAPAQGLRLRGGQKLRVHLLCCWWTFGVSALGLWWTVRTFSHVSG